MVARHAGCNTVCETRAHGPCLVPIRYDQILAAKQSAKPGHQPELCLICPI